MYAVSVYIHNPFFHIDNDLDLSHVFVTRRIHDAGFNINSSIYMYGCLRPSAAAFGGKVECCRCAKDSGPCTKVEIHLEVVRFVAGVDAPPLTMLTFV